MTSKEALEILEAYCTDYDSSEQPILDCEDELNIIKKDLEILEIIKKHSFINSWGEIVYDSKHHYQYINGDECKLFKPNEEDTKIKEWLKDDK